jgi:hypothetical protein
MGVVYEVAAPQATPGEPPGRLALKLLTHRGGTAAERFAREAEVLRRIQHPNVVAVHESGVGPDGTPFLVADLVEGEELAQRLTRGGPLPPAEAARIVAAVARGIAAAHAVRVLHRDLKPQNIMLRKDGAPVLLDFGIARDEDGSTLTQSGAMVGTPMYMSPEQADGVRELGPATDVYGLGAVLLACLAGRPPFPDTESSVQLLRLVLDGKPRWPSVDVPGVPPSLEAIVRRAMARDPAARPGSALALADELEAWIARGDREAPGPGRARWTLLGVGVALLAGLVVAGLALGQPAVQRATDDAPPLPPRPRAVTEQVGPAPLAAGADPVLHTTLTLDGAGDGDGAWVHLLVDGPGRLVAWTHLGRAHRVTVGDDLGVVVYGHDAWTPAETAPGPPLPLVVGPKGLLLRGAPGGVFEARSGDRWAEVDGIVTALGRIPGDPGALAACVSARRADERGRLVRLSQDGPPTDLFPGFVDAVIGLSFIDAPQGLLVLCRSAVVENDGMGYRKGLLALRRTPTEAGRPPVVEVLDSLPASGRAWSLSPDGNTLALGLGQGYLPVLDLSRPLDIEGARFLEGVKGQGQGSDSTFLGSLARHPLAHTDEVLGVAFSPRGDRLYSAAGLPSGRLQPRELALWDLRSDPPARRVFGGPGHRYVSLVLVPPPSPRKDALLVAGTVKGTLEVWRVPGG